MVIRNEYLFNLRRDHTTNSQGASSGTLTIDQQILIDNCDEKLHG
jgi:hypothetical protein